MERLGGTLLPRAPAKAEAHSSERADDLSGSLLSKGCGKNRSGARVSAVKVNHVLTQKGHIAPIMH